MTLLINQLINMCTVMICTVQKSVILKCQNYVDHFIVIEGPLEVARGTLKFCGTRFENRSCRQ